MSGLKMMVQNGLIDSVAGISKPLDAFRSFFLRLDIQVAEIDLTIHPTQIRPSMFSPLDEMPLPLDSLQEASDYLEALWNACIRLGIGQHDQCKRARCRNSYDRWLRAFNATPMTAQGASLSGYQYRISLIHLRRLDTYLALYGPTDKGAQVEWDRHMDAFTEIARYATAVAASAEMESTHFTMTGGVLSPILRFVMRCRHPLVRRVGIDILRRLPRAEGPLTGFIASRILQRIVEIEEGL
ncbi:hypothetical protein EDB80DRAFT_409644 [Ilyonectria destructans]|nr:hypothetical protein EDB80DRAFT_409644 [Ilyonectria destructans]